MAVRDGVTMRQKFLAALAVAALVFAAPAESASQSSAPPSGWWLTLGVGGSVVNGSLDRTLPVELALQRGANLLAFRFLLNTKSPDSFGLTELVGLLYGRARSFGNRRLSVASGLSWICVSSPSEPIADPTQTGTVSPHKDVIGVPIVVEASFTPSRFLGAGIQVFGNINSVESFIGMALVVKVGSLRGPGSGK